MTETTTPATETDTAQQPAEAARLPIQIRLLRIAALALALVALYAIVQVTSGDDDVPSGADPNASLTGGQVLRAGDVAPDFTVPTLDGELFSLSGHLATDGRPVFVNMWAEWCIPCRAEMPAIDAAAQDHPEVHFIGVVVKDEEAPARKFVEELGIRYQIGLDADRTIENDYLVWVMPSTYLVGSDGTIVERFFGPITVEQIDELVAEAADA